MQAVGNASATAYVDVQMHIHTDGQTTWKHDASGGIKNNHLTSVTNTTVASVIVKLRNVAKLSHHNYVNTAMHPEQQNTIQLSRSPQIHNHLEQRNELTEHTLTAIGHRTFTFQMESRDYTTKCSKCTIVIHEVI